MLFEGKPAKPRRTDCKDVSEAGKGAPCVAVHLVCDELHWSQTEPDEGAWLSKAAKEDRWVVVKLRLLETSVRSNLANICRDNRCNQLRHSVQPMHYQLKFVVCACKSACCKACQPLKKQMKNLSERGLVG